MAAAINDDLSVFIALVFIFICIIVAGEIPTEVFHLWVKYCMIH